MVRRWLISLVLVGAALSLPASYKIFLVNGKVITASDKPVIRDGIAYFQKSGMELYLPVDQIDLVKTERGGALPTSPMTEGPERIKPATRTIGEEQLEEISKRSRLANEGELRAPVADEGEEGAKPAAGGAPSGAAAGDRTALQGQMSTLLAQRTQIQKSMVDLQTQLGQVRERYNTATQQADKEALQGQMDGLQSQLSSTRSQLDSINGTLQDTQQKLSSTPVVVERGT